MRAASNAFGCIGDAPSIALVVNGHDCMVNVTTLKEYCAFVRDKALVGTHPERPDLPEHDPAIVRAFIDTISPIARDSLPDHDIVFTETP